MREIYIKKKNIYLHDVKLVLGEYYYVYYYNRYIKVKLIQVTEYGYNLLNEETNCCVLKRHMYVPKKYRELCQNNEKIFFISDKFYLYRKKKGLKDGEFFQICV